MADKDNTIMDKTSNGLSPHSDFQDKNLARTSLTEGDAGSFASEKPDAAYHDDEASQALKADKALNTEIHFDDGASQDTNHANSEDGASAGYEKSKVIDDPYDEEALKEDFLKYMAAQEAANGADLDVNEVLKASREESLSKAESTKSEAKPLDNTKATAATADAPAVAAVSLAADAPVGAAAGASAHDEAYGVATSKMDAVSGAAKRSKVVHEEELSEEDLKADFLKYMAAQEAANGADLDVNEVLKATREADHDESARSATAPSSSQINVQDTGTKTSVIKSEAKASKADTSATLSSDIADMAGADLKSPPQQDETSAKVGVKAGAMADAKAQAMSGAEGDGISVQGSAKGSAKSSVIGSVNGSPKEAVKGAAGGNDGAPQAVMVTELKEKKVAGSLFEERPEIDPEQADEKGFFKRRNEFKRSLQFRIMMVFAFAGLITTACMGVMSYLKIYNTTQEFVDEELSQIATVAINYKTIIPRRWEAPRHNHERVIRLRQRDGRVIVEYGTPVDPEADKDKPTTPSISDLHKFNYEIIIAPLYGRPGDALYIPPGVADGFYTVLVADQRVRAFVATNTAGQRFVVARPLKTMDSITRQALINSIWQFVGINMLFIPLLMISVKLMFLTLNVIAKSLYKRSKEDLSPVIPQNHVGFVPSELDGFIIAINRLFSRVDDGIQSKRRFIADAAHEMRTPLTALSLQAEALEKEELSESARKKVQRLKEGISRERELMTSLLTLAREQNRSELMLETIDILQLYIKIIDEQGVLADRKNIDLGVEGNAQFSIVTDRMRLTRVMTNLVSNAIKYTPEGGQIDLMVESLDNGACRLIVKDNGPGIPEEHIKHILEPFYRVDGDRSEVQGTGLGLSIVKASCDSLKAELNFENAKPHGLIASVTLKPLSLAALSAFKEGKTSALPEDFVNS